MRTVVIAYRGQGLRGDQTMSRGNKLLESAMLSRTPVRYWTGPKGGPFTFDKWTVITEVGRVRELDEDGVLSLRFVWFLQPVGGPRIEDWPQDLRATPKPEETPAEELAEENAVPNSGKNYADICESLGDPEDSVDQVNRGAAKRYKRKRLVREMVIARSGGVCENPVCTGMPCDVGPKGIPLLDVDHIVALAEGGSDHPLNAVALCPNCHRAKTLGANRSSLVRALKKVVQRRHAECLDLQGRSSRKSSSQ